MFRRRDGYLALRFPDFGVVNSGFGVVDRDLVLISLFCGLSGSVSGVETF